MDYRRYGEVLFDVLIAGGLLVPGGSISPEGETPKTECCMFSAADDMDSMRNQEQVSCNAFLSSNRTSLEPAYGECYAEAGVAMRARE